MPKPVTLFKKTTGLNNTENPNRLSFDPSTGETELVSAYNVDVGDTGDVSRRRGLTATARTENIHNDLSLGMKMSYCQVIEKTYYTNGFQQGCIVDGTSYSWAAGTYVGPTTHRVFSDPPVGNLLTYLSSRIYIAQGMVGWYSEPFAYGQFDLAKNFIPFGQKIRMWKAVAGGIYVGLNDVVIFLAGTDPKDFNFKVVLDSPVVEGTDVYASGDEIGSGEQTEKVVLWTASGGIYVGQADGKVRNVTSGKIVIPESSYGCAVYSDGEYIVLFQ
jgi:hypothetical protein